MKEYHVNAPRPARADINGKCAVCGKEIKKGVVYSHIHAAGTVFYFCNDCKVDQALVGKNRTTSTISEPVVPEPKPAETTEQEQPTPEPKSRLVYCKKCHRTHEIDSKKYNEHKAFMAKD